MDTWIILYNKIRAMKYSQLTFFGRIYMDELNKASFLADFFCSELAVEVYKNAVREVTTVDRVTYITNFADKLWEEIYKCIEEEDGTDYLG